MEELKNNMKTSKQQSPVIKNKRNSRSCEPCGDRREAKQQETKSTITCWVFPHRFYRSSKQRPIPWFKSEATETKDVLVEDQKYAMQCLKECLISAFVLIKWQGDILIIAFFAKEFR